MSNMTYSETAYPSVVYHRFLWLRIAQSLVFLFVFFLLLFFFSHAFFDNYIACHSSVYASDYPFDIFILFKLLYCHSSTFSIR